MALNIQEFDAVVGKMREIVVAKNADYSGTIDNIALTGLPGIAVRLLDKVARVHSLTTRPGAVQQVKDEAVMDTLLDIANYAIIGVILAMNKWDKKEQK